MTDEEIEIETGILKRAKTKKPENREEYISLSRKIASLCKRAGYTHEEILKKIQ